VSHFGAIPKIDDDPHFVSTCGKEFGQPHRHATSSQYANRVFHTISSWFDISELLRNHIELRAEVRFVIYPSVWHF